MDYIDVKKAAELWGYTERRVTALCRYNRIPGAKKSGKLWLIPDDAENRSMQGPANTLTG